MADLATYQNQENAAIAPAVSSLQAQQPSLTQRYQNALDTLTNRENTDITNTQLADTREFGKRGIPISSGSFDQALTQHLAPIRQNYNTQISDVNNQRDTALTDLATKIATMQSGAGQRAIDAFRADQAAAAARAAAASSGFSFPNFLSGLLGGNRLGGAQPDSATPQLSQTEKQIQADINNGHINFPQIVAKYAKILPLEQIYSDFTAVNPWGAPKESQNSIQAIYNQNRGGGGASSLTSTYSAPSNLGALSGLLGGLGGVQLR